MNPTSPGRSHSPLPSKKIYFEKNAGAGVVLRCELIVVKFGAFVYGDEEGIEKGFSGTNGESQATKYVESLGYVPALDWQLPPSA
jgi:hypothetical protein